MQLHVKPHKNFAAMRTTVHRPRGRTSTFILQLCNVYNCTHLHGLPSAYSDWEA